MAGHRSAGTRPPRMRQLLTADCRMPNALASLPTPPAASIASSSACMGRLSPGVLRLSTGAMLGSRRRACANAPMDFGATLKRLRKAAGLTQDQLAAACEFGSQSRIGNYEAGRGLPSIPDLLTMARVLQDRKS